MLTWRAGAAPPAGGGNATSVSAAIRFQFVTSLGCAAAEAACTPTVAIGVSAPSTTIEVTAAAETNRLRVFILFSLVAVLDPVRSQDRLARKGKRSPFDFRRIFRWP